MAKAASLPDFWANRTHDALAQTERCDSDSELSRPTAEEVPRLSDLNPQEMGELVKQLVSQKYRRNPDLAASVASKFVLNLVCGETFLQATDATLAAIGISLDAHRAFLLSKRTELEAGIPAELIGRANAGL